MINIISWNINSIRARLDALVLLVQQEQPDVILLQETKVQNHDFPYEAVEGLGYNLLVHGEKSYNGVAILSRGPIEDAQLTLPGDETDIQTRYAECVTTINGRTIRVSSVYVPNGTSVKAPQFSYKKKFFDRLLNHFNDIKLHEEVFIAGGDYNVAPENIDVYSPNHLEGQLGFHIEERLRFRAILATGMIDSYRALHPKQQAFSWWDYRGNGWTGNKGMRIDHLLISPQGADLMQDSGMHQHFRAMDKCSDHIPIYCKI